MYYFILNPASHSSEKVTVWSRVQQILHQRGIPHQVIATKYKGHAEKISHDISSRDPNATIICVGGDGSIHEILNGLTNLNSITFGVIPNGSGNDFARGMHLRRDPQEALETILHPGLIVPMDIGYLKINDKVRRFGVSAGIGFDASICQEALSSPIKDTLNAVHLGSFTYGAIALKQILIYKPGPMSIRLDGGRKFHYPGIFFICIMNQKYEGGGFMMAPEAKPNDGILDLFVVGDGVTRGELVSALTLTRFGKQVHFPHVHFLRCTSAEIRADEDRPIHLDGESGGIHDVIQAGILPEKLNVIVR